MSKPMRLPTCTVQLNNGRFCDAPGAADMPFPICGRHATSLYRRVRDLIDTADVETNPHLLLSVLEQTRREQQQSRGDIDPHVYYVQVGELIKIGYSGRLAARIRSYPPDSTLLAVEQGTVRLERERLSQFAHLLAACKEWFRPAPDLLAHIASLQPAAA